MGSRFPVGFKSSRVEVSSPSGGGFSPDPDLPIYRRIRDRTSNFNGRSWQKQVFVIYLFILDRKYLFGIKVYRVDFNVTQPLSDMVYFHSMVISKKS